VEIKRDRRRGATPRWADEGGVCRLRLYLRQHTQKVLDSDEDVERGDGSSTRHDGKGRCSQRWLCRRVVDNRALREVRDATLRRPSPAHVTVARQC
jgi:hypothetical protein